MWNAWISPVLEAFYRIPFVAQWLTVSIAKSLIASVLMSFVANYATALFAVRNGFRVPVEGVPFLNFAVGLASFSAFMCTLAMFAAIMGAFYYFRASIAQNLWFARAIERALGLDRASDAEARRAQRQAAITRLIRHAIGNRGVIVVAAAFYLAAIYSLFGPLPMLAETESYFGNKGWAVMQRFEFQFVFIIVMVSAVAGIWCAARNYGWIVAQFIATTMIFGAFSAGLFAPDVYGSFLRVIRSGGGIAIEAQVREKSGAPPVTKRGYMLLLSQSYLIITGETGSRVTEIPIREVLAIEYDIHPSWVLPKYALGKQREFIRLERFE